MTKAIVPKELLTATPGGLSLLVVSGGADGQVLTQQADGTYAPEAISAASGDVVGPASATDNAVARYDATTGKLLQNSLVTISDAGIVQISPTGTNGLNIGTSNGTNQTLSFGAGGTTIQGGNGFCIITTGGTFSIGSTAIAFSGNKLQLGSSVDTLSRGGDGTITLTGNAADVVLAPAGTEKVRVAANGLVTNVGPVRMGVYTFATVPSASTFSGGMIRISDRAQRTAYSDGTNWRFTADDVIIS